MLNLERALDISSKQSSIPAGWTVYTLVDTRKQSHEISSEIRSYGITGRTMIENSRIGDKYYTMIAFENSDDFMTYQLSKN